MVPKLPKTNIRLATSVSFFILREDAISLATFFKSIFQPRQEVADVQRQMKPINNIVSFSEDQSRETSHRHETDSNVRGEPLQVLGGPVRRTLKLKRAVLYKSDLITDLGYHNELKRAGTKDGGLLSQSLRSPFIIIRKEVSPEASGVAPVITFYRGCIISSITRSYDITSSLGVFEDANIAYAGRQQFTT